MMIMAALGPTPDNVIQASTEPGMQGDDGEQTGPTSASGKIFTISTSNTTNTFHTII